MGFFTFLIIALIVFIIFAVIAGTKAAEKNAAHANFVKTKLSSIGNFEPTNIFTSTTSGVSFAIDTENKKVWFFDAQMNENSYDFDKILECELVIDGETIVKTSTSSAVGRAVIGGLLTGGVGALIGGVTASKTNKEEIKSIDLKIIVNDISKPIYKVNFLNVSTKKGGMLYNACFPIAERWHSVYSGIIKGNESNNKDLTSTTIHALSPSDEIRKLKALLDEGIITPDEFQLQKVKYLGQ